MSELYSNAYQYLAVCVQHILNHAHVPTDAKIIYFWSIENIEYKKFLQEVRFLQ